MSRLQFNALHSVAACVHARSVRLARHIRAAGGCELTDHHFAELLNDPIGTYGHGRINVAKALGL